MELLCDFNNYLLLMTRLFDCGTAAQRSPGPPHSWDFYIIQNDASLSVELFWTSDQLIAQAYTCKHTTHTRDNRPCPRWDSNPHSQQTSGLRPRGYRDRQWIILFYCYILLLFYYNISLQEHKMEIYRPANYLSSSKQTFFNMLPY